MYVRHNNATYGYEKRSAHTDNWVCLQTSPCELIVIVGDMLAKL